MKRWVLAGILGCAAAALVGQGCSRPSLSRDEEVRLLMADLRALQDKLRACERRVAELTAAGAQPKPLAAPVADPFRAVAIRFGKYTGVLEGAKPGEERLKIILEPLDEESEIVKRAGSLELETFEPAAAGQPPKPFHRWEFPTADLAKTWLNMFGATGYVLKLPWPSGRMPAGPALVVKAKFTTLSGEVLTAETQVATRGPRGTGPIPPVPPKSPSEKPAK